MSDGGSLNRSEIRAAAAAAAVAVSAWLDDFIADEGNTNLNPTRRVDASSRRRVVVSSFLCIHSGHSTRTLLFSRGSHDTW
jgi:hypothetical protein